MNGAEAAVVEPGRQMAAGPSQLVAELWNDAKLQIKGHRFGNERPTAIGFIGAVEAIKLPVAYVFFWQTTVVAAVVIVLAI